MRKKRIIKAKKTPIPNALIAFGFLLVGAMMMNGSNRMDMLKLIEKEIDEKYGKKKLSLRDLQKELDLAVSKEEYEKAAELFKMIQEKKNKKSSPK